MGGVSGACLSSKLLHMQSGQSPGVSPPPTTHLPLVKVWVFASGKDC